MKILSIAVPCYNSQEYMRKCVDSLLKGGEDVEILIVDDGSKDDTLKIARDYEEKYPTIVKAIHQENKGHGGAVNTGLAHATGLYFKVVDSDDWLNEEALKKALEVLKLCVRGPKVGIIKGRVTSVIFKGVHYEMTVLANNFEWLVHSTDMYPADSEVGIFVKPFNIQITHKPESEDEKAVDINE